MTQAPVTFGVPMPKIPDYVIPSMESHWICVRNPAGQIIPHQYKVLSRWDGTRDDVTKSLKWVQVTFLADCPPNTSVDYSLSIGIKPIGQMVAQWQPDRLVVSPMPGTSFSIDRFAFRLFKEATVDGQAIVVAPGGGLRMEDETGAIVTPQITETRIEQGGTVRFVVCQRGLLNDLRFTVRYYFHSGCRDVRVDFRLENPGAYGYFFGVQSEHRYFDFIRLWLPINGAGSQVTTSDGTRALGGAVYELNQDFAWGSDPLDVLGSFSFEERAGSNILHSGTRSDGGVDLTGSNGGVTVCVDRFWQNFPKTMRVAGDEVEIALFPEWGNGPEYAGQYATPTSGSPIDPLALSNFRFEGGRWKTHTVNFDFHSGARTPSEVALVAERTNRPLAGRASAEWTNYTGALGSLFASQRTWNDVGLDRWERFYAMLVDDSAADNQLQLGQIGLRGFRNRGGTYGGRQFYGWENFGDLMWGNGSCSLHYDWTYQVLMGWVRGGSYEYLDVARDMAFHRRDYDQNHSQDLTEFWRGAQFYEKGWWHGNFLFGQNSHNWVHGILLHYALTGDEGSYEAAREAQDFLLRNSPRNWTGYYGARIPGWATLNLVDLYNYLGEAPAIIEARAGIETFQDLENQAGGAGYVSNLGGGLVSIPWMHSIMFHATAKYTLVGQDASFVPLMQRMKTWLLSCVNSPAITTVMPMPSVTEIYQQNGQHEGSSVHHMWYVADAITLSAMMFGDQTDIDVAYLLFESAARFHQSVGGNTIDFDDAETYSPIAMRMWQYPNSETKIISGVLHGGHSYGALRAWLTRSSY